MKCPPPCPAAVPDFLAVTISDGGGSGGPPCAAPGRGEIAVSGGWDSEVVRIPCAWDEARGCWVTPGGVEVRVIPPA